MVIYMSIERKKRVVSVSKECVACGSCIKVCKKEAITVPKGVVAVVDEQKCVGCGLCAKVCPASVISIHTISQITKQTKIWQDREVNA